jgi:hypothetical protein
MNEPTECRSAERRPPEAGGSISFGQDPIACRVIDLSDSAAQVRIDGKRASRTLVGKRASLTLEGTSRKPLEGRVVWARPAVHGVYLGISVDAEVRSVPDAAQ